MNIDSSQTGAIRHHTGPAMVLAGPGSGKTTVITHRVKYLLEHCHVDPGHILVITFTRAAALQMRERFYRLMGEKRPPVSFGTFHSIYFYILKQAYGIGSANVASEEQRTQFVREYIHRLRLEYEDENDFIISILGEISLVKNAGMNLAYYYAACCGEEVFRKIYGAYQEFLEQNRLLDFDDMLVYTKELFLKRPDILKGWQEKYQYILIDEFQDINQIQYDIVKMLAAPQNHLFIVGDDDQSIYRFRGAKPEIMLNFEADFPDTVKHYLSVNYRSGKSIVEHAGNLIRHNTTRFAKDIRPAATTGRPVVYREFKNQREQNDYLLREMQRLHLEEQVPYDDMAVLFRTNAQPRFLMEQMITLNIPFVAKDRIPNIYEHWIAQDIFTYIRLAMGDRSRQSMLRIMNRPKRYLSRESLPYEEVAFDVWREYYKKQEWVAERIDKLAMDLRVLGRLRPFSAISYIRKSIAYEDYLKDYAEYRHIAADDLFELLEELQEHARGFETYEAWFSHIQEMQKEFSQQDSLPGEVKEEAVHLCTLHSAKGLEFDTVFIIDVNEKIMPYKKAVLEPDVEEERRMFYVGMTRAKEQLYLLSSLQVHNKDMEISRFIQESKINKKE